MIPPLVGFFAKQMVLSAAIDQGYIFLALVAILTSVIGGVYYLNIIKEMFFYSPDYKLNEEIKNNSIYGQIVRSIRSNQKNNRGAKRACALNVEFNYTNVVMSSSVATTISIITLVVLLFMFMNQE